MRTLLYVPIIHTSADLGSLAKDVAKRGVADLGEDLWEEHRKIVDGFWEVIANYFDSEDVSGVKIYQDGMVAEGEIGEMIVKEGEKSGSRNYELVSRLLKRGAFLVKTEDFNLVKEERDRLLSITQAKSTLQKITAYLKYKFIKDRLLDKRDKFIAQRINETLKSGGKGILFIGAFHDVRKWLSWDIRINEIKQISKIREYYSLLPFYPRNKEKFAELARYLISPIGA